MCAVSDVHDVKTRSRNMAAIRHKDTKPEVLIRKSLHKRGFRYSLHNKNLPGKPDVVLPKYNAVIFVHGCFWHEHDCYLFKWPSTRRDFWEKKITGNKENDAKNIKKLRLAGWRIATVWECAIKGKYKLTHEAITDMLDQWLKGSDSDIEIRGNELDRVNLTT